MAPRIPPSVAPIRTLLLGSVDTGAAPRGTVVVAVVAAVLGVTVVVVMGTTKTVLGPTTVALGPAVEASLPRRMVVV